MVSKYHSNTLRRALGVMILVCCSAYNGMGEAPEKHRLVQAKPEPATIADEEKKEEPKGQAELAPKRKSPLPSVDQLVDAKLSALKAKQTEQEITLAQVETKLAQEEAIDKRTFDSNAYLSLSIINSAPPSEYRLLGTEIIVDGRTLARGGKRHGGLPYSKDLYFGPMEPGCHEILVKAKYVRLKNALLNTFKVSRVVNLSRTQTFIAKNGQRVEIEIEGFEAENSLARFFRGPELRFNKSVRPNFLPGAPIVSMDDVLKQGRVHIDYLDESASHRLLEKSLSIDGLPVLVAEKHDLTKEGKVVFDAPLAEGKHTLSVTLFFGEKKWVGGGPLYNFRLKFDRDFYVISGQTTIVNLIGMPKDGIRSEPMESRYARATSKILSEQNPEFFPSKTCKEILAKEKALEKPVVKEAEPAPKPTVETPKEEEKPLEPVAPEAVPAPPEQKMENPGTEVKPEGALETKSGEPKASNDVIVPVESPSIPVAVGE